MGDERNKKKTKQQGNEMKTEKGGRRGTRKNTIKMKFENGEHCLPPSGKDTEGARHGHH